MVRWYVDVLILGTYEYLVPNPGAYYAVRVYAAADNRVHLCILYYGTVGRERYSVLGAKNFEF